MLPQIIQGGMGVGVSGWKLARAVALTGQLGVVSGTALDTMMVRRLQDGDIGGHVRRALAAFPVPEFSGRILKRFFRPVGRKPGEPYKLAPMYRQAASRFTQQLSMVANFVEVYLAREGHDKPIGINYLAKIQMPTLPSLYGAMLAGVDYVFMGAGIPKEIPGVLDRLTSHSNVSIPMDLVGKSHGDPAILEFNPGAFGTDSVGELKRPFFIPIVASNSLVTLMARKANGKVDGFVIEGPRAGGHNAPPRGKKVFNARGEPKYGPRDEVNLARVADEGLPFWVAGGAGYSNRLKEVCNEGATGIQVGTLFAYCDESGLTQQIKQSVIGQCLQQCLDVRTDDQVSPTGFPFKIVNVPGSIAEESIYAARTRICDLGYLREAVRLESGRIAYRCAAEPVDTYVANGGNMEDTIGRKCLCNSLLSSVGMGQNREGGVTEAPLITSGDELINLGSFLDGRSRYSAADVIEYLLS